jgi:hypothetical protein
VQSNNFILNFPNNQAITYAKEENEESDTGLWRDKKMHRLNLHRLGGASYNTKYKYN